jgi:sec-independent protein translocase protein TatB
VFDIGFSELVFIALLALIVLGPKRLPEIARTAGRWVAKLRQFVTNVKQDFDQQLNTEDLSELRKLKQELDDTRRQIELTTNKAFSEVSRETKETTAARPAGKSAAFDEVAKAASAKQKKPGKSSRPRRSRKKSSARSKHGDARRTRSG